MGARHRQGLRGIPQGGLDAPNDGRHREGVGRLPFEGDQMTDAVVGRCEQSASSGCKVWYLISRTVSDDDAYCGDMMIARSALSPPSPRLRRAAICGIGLDRSARPSKSGDRAANALTAMLGNQGTRLSDNVRQVECWFSQRSYILTSSVVGLRCKRDVRVRSHSAYHHTSHR
jgi:hypothetical protein